MGGIPADDKRVQLIECACKWAGEAASSATVLTDSTRTPVVCARTQHGFGGLYARCYDAGI